MPEENQNIQTTSNLRAETDRFQNVKQMLKDKVNNDFNLRRAKESETLYEKSLTSTNPDTCWQYDRACKVSELARGARSYWQTMGYDWSNVEDLDLVQQYSDAFPEAGKIMYNYITNAETNDPMPTYIELWWEQPNAWDKVFEFTKNVWENFFSFFNVWWDAVRNVIDMWIWAIEWDQTPWALENYAKMNYWKDFYSLTDEQKEEARNAVSTQEWLDVWEPSVQRIALKWWETVLDALFTWIAPWAKLWFSMAWAWAEADVPYASAILWWALWWLDKVNGFLWWIVSEIPWLKQYRNSLQTEQEKDEFDNLLWMIVLWKIMQKRWGRAKSSAWLKETILKELDPVTTIKEIDQRIKDLPSDAKQWAKNLASRIRDGKAKATQEKLEDTAGKIAWTKTVKERETATRALQDADIEWSKDYADLTERLKNRGKEIEAEEDIEYAKNEKKWKPAETRWMKDFEKDWYKSSVLLKPIEDWIELLKDFYEWSPEKLAQLDLIEQKFNAEWLTKWEMNNIARAIVDEYDTYKKRGEPKNSIAAKDIEWIRRAVKEFAREGNDKLVELDKKWSDNLNTRQMISDIQDKIVNFTSNQRYKNVFQKLTWAAADIVVYLWGREILQKLWLVSKEISWPNEYTPVLRQSDLKKLTNKFTKLDKKLNWAKSKAEAEKIVEDFNNEMNEEFWPIDGEVIEKAKSEWYKDGNSYLEDKIEVKEETNP